MPYAYIRRKPAQNRLSKSVGRRGEPSDPAAWRCCMPSSGVVEAVFVRIGILGKPSPIYDFDLPRALKLSRECDGAETAGKIDPA